MAERKMVPLPNTHYTVELRSGRVITIDEGFENLFGYTQADVDAGLVFKHLVPCVEVHQTSNLSSFHGVLNMKTW